jgi:hypothetical protein
VEFVVPMAINSTKSGIRVNKQKEIYTILLSAKRFTSRNVLQFMHISQLICLQVFVLFVQFSFDQIWLEVKSEVEIQ